MMDARRERPTKSVKVLEDAVVCGAALVVAAALRLEEVLEAVAEVVDAEEGSAVVELSFASEEETTTVVGEAVAGIRDVLFEVLLLLV